MPDPSLERAFALTSFFTLLLGVAGLTFGREAFGGTDFQIGLCLFLAPLCALGAVMVRSRAQHPVARRAPDHESRSHLAIARRASPIVMVTMLVVMVAGGLSASAAIGAIAGVLLLLWVIFSVAAEFEPDV